MCIKAKKPNFITKRWRAFLNDLSTVSQKDRDSFWWPAITSLIFYLMITVLGVYFRIKRGDNSQSFDLESYILDSVLSLYSTVCTFCITTIVQCIVHVYESDIRDFRIGPFIKLLLIVIIYSFIYFICLLENSMLFGGLLLAFSAIVIWQTIRSFVAVHKNSNPLATGSLSGYR